MLCRQKSTLNLSSFMNIYILERIKLLYFTKLFVLLMKILKNIKAKKKINRKFSATINKLYSTDNK